MESEAKEQVNTLAGDRIDLNWANFVIIIAYQLLLLMNQIPQEKEGEDHLGQNRPNIVPSLSRSLSF